MIDGIIEEFHFYMIWDVMLSPDHPTKIVKATHIAHFSQDDPPIPKMNLIPIDAGLYPSIDDL